MLTIVRMDFNRFKNRIRDQIAFFLEHKKKAFLFVLAFLVLIGIYSLTGCPIKRITGIPCPGCGMSRAWRSVLTFHFKDAFLFHPLWSVPLIVLFLVLKDHKDPLVSHPKFMNFLIVLFLFTYIIRIIMHDPIVTWNIDRGIIYHIIEYIKKWIS